MNINDTIAAIATPVGYSAIGMIRISGDRCKSIIGKLFVNETGIDPSAKPRQQVLGQIVDPLHETPIDRTVAVFMKAPNSYTGEDMIELSCHGNPLILEKIMSVLNSQGVRSAQEGEFTYRAYLNGKMDLTQAEAINRLAQAMTTAEVESALHQVDGELRDKINSWEDKLTGTISRLEAEIEFSADQAESFFDVEKEIAHLKAIFDEVDRLLKSYRFGSMLRHGVDVVITGRANTGKSTLFNLLLESDRSIVTDIPGTTRDVVSETIDIEGLPIRLHDTAGIEEHTGVMEKEGVKRARIRLEDADIILVLLDGSREYREKDKEILNITEGKKRIVLINKDDLEKHLNEGDIPEHVSRETIRVSALKNYGIDRLKKQIIKALGWKQPNTIDTPLLQSRRQKELLLRFKSALSKSIDTLKNDFSEEIAAIELRSALAPLGEVTGAFDIEGIYDRIFSNFCIGK